MQSYSSSDLTTAIAQDFVQALKSPTTSHILDGTQKDRWNAELAKLNAIVHPAVREQVRRIIVEITASDPHAVIVYVAAILIESGGMEGMSKLIVVTCTQEQQIARALERPGATKASVLARLKHQLPMDEKIARANYVIDTSGTREDTLRQTKMVFEELRKLAA